MNKAQISRVKDAMRKLHVFYCKLRVPLQHARETRSGKERLSKKPYRGLAKAVDEELKRCVALHWAIRSALRKGESDSEVIERVKDAEWFLLIDSYVAAAFKKELLRLFVDKDDGRYNWNDEKVLNLFLNEVEKLATRNNSWKSARTVEKKVNGLKYHLHEDIYLREIMHIVNIHVKAPKKEDLSIMSARCL